MSAGEGIKHSGACFAPGHSQAEPEEVSALAGECPSRKFKVLSLFAGIGGFDLGLERTGGFETVAFCEIDPFCRRVLAKHWPEVPCYHDVRELTAERLEADGIAADVVCGGFPCQPFSSASRGRRVATDFWPEMRRVIGELRPRFVIAENVQRAPIARAREHLEQLGYRGSVHNLTAARAGADHQRSRWWFCAYADDQSQLPLRVHAEVARVQEVCRGLWGPENYARAIRVPDGVPYRMERIGRLGNAVLPIWPELIGRAILAAEAA
jgi:DNA (cytosine-5)-methyltransferase 1